MLSSITCQYLDTSVFETDRNTSGILEAEIKKKFSMDYQNSMEFGYVERQIAYFSNFKELLNFT